MHGLTPNATSVPHAFVAAEIADASLVPHGFVAAETAEASSAPHGFVAAENLLLCFAIEQVLNDKFSRAVDQFDAIPENKLGRFLPRAEPCTSSHGTYRTRNEA